MPIEDVSGDSAGESRLRRVRALAAAAAGEGRDERRREPRRPGVEPAMVIRGDQRHEVQLLNVSRGGAMISAPFAPEAGEQVHIALGGCNPTRCVVRWIEDGRIGLEFVKETVVLMPGGGRGGFGRRQSGDGTEAGGAPGQAGTPAKQERAERSKVLWQCTLYSDRGTFEVGLRNISSSGAMVACRSNLKPGTDVMLALKAAGTMPARVRWCRSGQIGLQFDGRFDVTKLLDPRKLAGGADGSRPGILKPMYLETELDADSPWAARTDKLQRRDLS